MTLKMYGLGQRIQISRNSNSKKGIRIIFKFGLIYKLRCTVIRYILNRKTLPLVLPVGENSLLEQGVVASWWDLTGKLDVVI
jgi:hypothetical protein